MDRFDNNIYISNLKDAILSIGFPMMLTGSIFYIAANPSRGTDFWIFKIWLSAAVEVKAALMVPYYFTWGMVSLITAFIYSYRLSKKMGINPVLSGVVSSLSFLSICFAGGVSGTFTIESITNVTGPNGMLTAFLTSTICVKLMKYFDDKKLYFSMEGMSPSLTEAFKNMFFIMAIIPSMWIIGWMLSNFFEAPLPTGIIIFVKYIISMSSNLTKDIVCSLMASVLYFTGMDGGLIKQPVYNVFMNQGGFGTLLPLVILYMLSYSKQLKQVGKSVIIPALFNVPYPIVFASPLILNPIYLIPFVIVPVLSTIINYLILLSGILTVTVESTYTMPVILSGYFSTTGQILGILLQVFDFVLALLIYYPFFIYHESRLVNVSENKYNTSLDSQNSSEEINNRLPWFFKRLKHNIDNQIKN